MKISVTAIIALLMILGVTGCNTKKPSSQPDTLSSLEVHPSIVNVIVASKNIEKGTVLSLENMAVMSIKRSKYRPEHSYFDEQLELVLGKVITRPLEYKEIITPDHIK